MRRRDRRQDSTRDRILHQLKKSLTDTLTAAAPKQSPPCECDECRAARARDVSPDPRILQVQPADFRRMLTLALRHKMTDDDLSELTLHMFGKVPVMLREIEAAAVIAHLERGQF